MKLPSDVIDLVIIKCLEGCDFKSVNCINLISSKSKYIENKISEAAARRIQQGCEPWLNGIEYYTYSCGSFLNIPYLVCGCKDGTYSIRYRLENEICIGN